MAITLRLWRLYQDDKAVRRGGGATNLDGFFSQRKTDRKHPSSRRRVSPSVSLKKIQMTFKNVRLTPRSK